MTANTYPASPAQLAWLEHELSSWGHEGLLEPAAAAAIRGRYHPSRWWTVSGLALSVGAAFLGVGLIWLVAANIQDLSPITRLVAISLIWLTLLVAGELLAARLSSGRASGAVVGALRLTAALTFGAVVFQASQSLQVPAYEPGLVGLWGAGALAHAYLVRGLAPLAVGLAAGCTWWVWLAVDDTASGLGFVLFTASAGAIAVGVAARHPLLGGDRPTPYAGFAAAWRETGALLMLVGLFVAGIPSVTVDEAWWSPWLTGALVLAGLLVGVAGLRGVGADRVEPLAVAAVGLAAAALVWWEAGSDGEIGTQAWAHGVLSVVVFVAVAMGVAVAGARRDSWRLTGLALVSLVAFTTFQSFAVFAEIVDGAWLFLVLGAVLAGTGWAFDRARRQLVLGVEAGR